MTDEKIQRPGKVMQSPKPSDWRSDIGADDRQRSLERVAKTMMLLPQSKNLSEVEKLAKRVEEEAFSLALNRSDYLKKIRLKCYKLINLAEIAASQLSPVSSTTGTPTSFNSESRNILPVETQQNRLVQLVNHTHSSSEDVSGVLSSAVTAAVQTLGRGDKLSGTASGSQDSTELTRDATVLTRAPWNSPKISEVAASVDVVGNVEDVSEYMCQWILSMKDKYLEELVEQLPVFNRWLKEFQLKPEHPHKDMLKKIQDGMSRLKHLIVLLTLSREKVKRMKPAKKERLDAWEEKICAHIQSFEELAGNLAPERGKKGNQDGRSERIELMGTNTDTDLLSHSPQKIQRLLPEEQPIVYPESDTLLLPISRDTGESHLSASRLPHATPLIVSECDNLNINVGHNSENISPIQRLVNALRSVSSDSLKSAVKDISSVVSLVDGRVASAPGTGVKSALGQDLMWTRGCSMPSKSLNPMRDIAGTCYPRQFTHEMRTKESTTESSIKYPTTEATHTLMQEIEEINGRLIDTVVKIVPVTRGTPGIMLECCFEGVSVSSSLTKYMKLQGISTTIQPLRLSVPADYSGGAPIGFDDFNFQTGDASNDLTRKAKWRFDMRPPGVKNSLSLKEIVVMWDDCCREVFAEYAKKYGGGNFSSIYGTWSSCIV